MKRIFAIFKFGIKLFLIYTAFVIFLIIFFRFIHPPVSAFIYSNNENPIVSLFSFDDVKHKPVSINKISRYSVLAVVASEDQLFFEHFGFDFEQIEKAMKENTRRKRIRGASTISMQLAKNMFLWPGKNFIRKGFEAYYTVLLEIFWSKERIVGEYLNLAEMGKGIYGVQAASKIYFNKNAVKLNPDEAAYLAAVLPNPKKRDPRKPSRYLLSRKSTIMQQMNLIGGLEMLKKYIN
jgi:monofunctional biosynthetic peptidoglycan transglycosylase